MMDPTFSILSTDLIASVCVWKVLLTSGLFSRLICSFRKDILSSIIFCRVTITIWYISGEAKLEMDGYNPANTLRRGWGFIVIIIKIIIITHQQRVIVRLLKLLTPAGFSQGSDMFLSPIEQAYLNGTRQFTKPQQRYIRYRLNKKLRLLSEELTSFVYRKKI